MKASEAFFSPLVEDESGEDEVGAAVAGDPDKLLWLQAPPPPVQEQPLLSPEQRTMLLTLPEKHTIPPLPSSHTPPFQEVFLPESRHARHPRLQDEGYASMFSLRLSAVPSMALPPLESNPCRKVLEAMAQRAQHSRQVALQLLQEEEVALAGEDPSSLTPLHWKDACETVQHKAAVQATRAAVEALRQGVRKLDQFLENVQRAMPPPPREVYLPGMDFPPIPRLSALMRWTLLLLARRPCRSLILLVLLSVLRHLRRGSLRAEGCLETEVLRVFRELCTRLSLSTTVRLLELMRDPELKAALQLKMQRVHKTPSFSSLLTGSERATHSSGTAM